MKKININELSWDEGKSPARKYHSYYKNISLLLGGKRDIGPWDGGHPFDLQMRRVPPGAMVCPLHAHTVQWELFVAVSGTATVRTDKETYTVKAGDAYMQAPGTAHQTINSGQEDFIFYVIADNSPADSTWYPDSKKWQMKPQRKLFRMVEVDYYDGEE